MCTETILKQVSAPSTAAAHFACAVGVSQTHWTHCLSNKPVSPQSILYKQTNKQQNLDIGSGDTYHNGLQVPPISTAKLKICINIVLIFSIL